MNDEQLPSHVDQSIEVDPPNISRPKQQRHEVTRFHTSVQFRGPLPPPSVLKQYEDICPGYAQRLITSFEAESAHRREMEHKVMNAQIRHDDQQFVEARRGQVFALTITIAAIVAGVYTAINGHEIAGSIIGVGGIGGIVTTFIIGRSDRHRKEESRDARAKNV